MKPFDINKLIRRVKRATGDGKYYTTGWSNNDYISVIEDEAISLISKYIRPYVELEVDLSEYNKVKGYNNRYYIDINKLVDSNLSIRDLRPLDDNLNDIFDDWGYFTNTSSMGDMINGVAAVEATSAYASEPRFKLVQPNMLIIDSYNVAGLSGMYKFTFYVDMILMAIPPQVEEVFTKLSIIKVKEALYNELDAIKNMNTPNGNISLPIEKWADVSSELEAIENELKLDRIDYEFQIHIM